MEELLPELRNAIGPRLKGKTQERQRTWIQVRVVEVGTSVLTPLLGLLPFWGMSHLIGCVAPWLHSAQDFVVPAAASPAQSSASENGGSQVEEAQPTSTAHPAIFSEPFLG